MYSGDELYDDEITSGALEKDDELPEWRRRENSDIAKGEQDWGMRDDET